MSIVSEMSGIALSCITAKRLFKFINNSLIADKLQSIVDHLREQFSHCHGGNCNSKRPMDSVHSSIRIHCIRDLFCVPPKKDPETDSWTIGGLSDRKRASFL